MCPEIKDTNFWSNGGKTTERGEVEWCQCLDWSFQAYKTNKITEKHYLNIMGKVRVVSKWLGMNAEIYIYIYSPHSIDGGGWIGDGKPAGMTWFMCTFASQRKRGSRWKLNPSLTHSPVGQLTTLRMIKTQRKWHLTTKSLLRMVIGSPTSSVSVVRWHNKNVMANTCWLLQAHATIFGFQT